MTPFCRIKFAIRFHENSWFSFTKKFRTLLENAMFLVLVAGPSQYEPGSNATSLGRLNTHKFLLDACIQVIILHGFKNA